jgi:uncharacterized protein YfaS (alpha-2-macroglobulin family)
MKKWLVTTATLAALGMASAALAQDATVESFSPEGNVKGVRQVTARFSAQMVPFGDLRLTDPFDVDCAEKGKGRWIDGKNWSYDFERDLPAGLACHFNLKPDLKDLKGTAMSGRQSFDFSTGGPSVVQSEPTEGLWIDEKQYFLLALDAMPKRDTIAPNVYCTAAGIGEKIGVTLIEGKEREELLEAQSSFADNYLNVFYQAHGAHWRTMAKLKNHRFDNQPIVALRCNRTLPAGADVRLVWGKDVTSTTGIANEHDQVLAYPVRPAFTARFACERANARNGCLPIRPMHLVFSAPVKQEILKGITLTGSDGKTYPLSFESGEGKSNVYQSVSFNGPFPEKSGFTLTLPAKFSDDSDRPLQNRRRFPLTVKTDEQPPLIKFPARFGIIEAHGDRMLPVTVRNVEPTLSGAIAGAHGNMLRITGDSAGDATSQKEDEAIIGWLKRLANSNGGWDLHEMWGREMEQSVFSGGEAKPFSMPKPSAKEEFEVVGIPLEKNGFYVVELESPKLGRAITRAGGTAYVQAAALMTNMAAHFEHGAESSLVWVTTLDQGKPVADAAVAVRNCDGSMLWQGKTDASGVAHIQQALQGATCRYSNALFVSARTRDDMTFTLSDWNGGIETWRFNVPTENFNADNVMATTVFDRTLLRAGETVHMKHLLRRHAQDGIHFADYGPATYKLVITHDGSGQHYELPLTWDGNASAESTWQIPADAKQGNYSLMIGNYQAGSFRVEAFRVPTMKALLQGPKETPVQAQQVGFDIQLNYLAGGGAGDATVKLRTVLQDKTVSFSGYEGYTFSNGEVVEGRSTDTPTLDEDDASWSDAGDGKKGNGAAATQTLKLDHHGAARVTVDKLPKVTAPHDLLAELEFSDANGEVSTVATRVPLLPSAYQIGIEPDGWAVSKDAFKFRVAVLDTEGKPVSNAFVATDFFRRTNYSHRHRLLGGFYAYENVNEVKRLGDGCSGKTDEHGLLFCATKAPASGNLVLQARTADTQGRAIAANADIWIAGSEYWWFNVNDNDRIDVLPEKKRYEPGEEAVFQVRMPFRSAMALIAVEREGIIDTYVRPLDAAKPSFTIPVKPGYAPNVYVSVLVVRGRVAGVQPTALVDLGKPAYKLGIAKLQVGWLAHELKVKVETDKPVHKVRDKAKVHIAVLRANGKKLPAGTEVAVAAVDAGLLELMPNTSWNLLDAMMQERPLQVETATAQMQVIGKRHFGRKAVPAGGGGGKSNGRELFDTLLYWKSKVVLDAKGEADVEVPLNDSMTEFRIVAVANGSSDLFGTGAASVRSTQDLILMSGLPPLVREDDQLRAGFTLRNTTDAAMTVDVQAAVGNPDNPKAAATHLASQRVMVEAGQAADVGWNYRVPLGVTNLAWDVSAKNADGSMSDRIKIKQRVGAATPVRVYQATLIQLEKPLQMSVRAPDDALPGRGGIQTTLRDKLGSDLPGVRDYMARYPYSCFEQRTSKAVSLESKMMWNDNMAILPGYLDSDGLVKYFPMMLYGSDTLTAYVLSIADEGGYAIPQEARERMEAGLVAFVQGKIVRGSPLPTADLAIRKVAALEALSRTGKVRGEMFDSFVAEPNLWPTSAVIDYYLALKRTPGLPQRDAKMEQAGQILHSRLNMQGTTMGFSTERSDELWWLMISTDVNANRVLLAMMDNPAWYEDIGRLVRGTLGRQHQGRWNTTVANAWGTVAMEKFTANFESVPVTGTAGVKLGQDSKTFDWQKQPTGGILMQAWPKGTAELDIEQKGMGKPWVTVTSMAAIPLKAPLSTGYRIVKTVTPVEQQKPGQWSRGDVYRVHIDIDAQSDMTWVVVDDPIPASATVLGSGLGRDSQIMSQGEQGRGWVWPAYIERGFDAYRNYFEFVPKGKFSVEYTARLNNEGDFTMPATRVEAMYSPEMFGELPNEVFHVRH